MGEPAPSLKAALAERYAIERELGRGGMATVYLARDLKHDRFVALKVRGQSAPLWRRARTNCCQDIEHLSTPGRGEIPVGPGSGHRLSVTGLP